MSNDEDKELQHYLLSRLRRPEQYRPEPKVLQQSVSCRGDLTDEFMEQLERTFAPPKPPVRKFGYGILDWVASLFKGTP